MQATLRYKQKNPYSSYNIEIQEIFLRTALKNRDKISECWISIELSSKHGLCLGKLYENNWTISACCYFIHKCFSLKTIIIYKIHDN